MWLRLELAGECNGIYHKRLSVWEIGKICSEGVTGLDLCVAQISVDTNITNRRWNEKAKCLPSAKKCNKKYAKKRSRKLSRRFEDRLHADDRHVLTAWLRKGECDRGMALGEMGTS